MRKHRVQAKLQSQAILLQMLIPVPRKMTQKQDKGKHSPGGKSKAKKSRDKDERRVNPINLDQTASRADQIRQVFGTVTPSSSSSGNENVTYRASQVTDIHCYACK